MSRCFIRGAQLALLLGCALSASCLKTAGVRYPGLPTPESGALQVIFFDVGQADAILVLYGGKTLLIDAGSARSGSNRATQRIPRRLDALLGGRHLDYFMISHYHQDHIGSPGASRGKSRPTGLFALVQADGITIDTVLDRGTWTADDKKGGTQLNYEEALRDWMSTGVIKNRRVVRVGDTIDLGPGLDVRVVIASGNGQLDHLRSRFPSFVADYPPSENDYSIGVKITLGDFELFTAGDLSGFNRMRDFAGNRMSYNDMESPIAEAVGAIEVLHPGHHGSRNSTNPCFADVVRPKVSIITSGPNNYGHPDLEVVEAAAHFGEVWTTGRPPPEVRRLLGDRAVADDVEVVVAKDGGTYWVNGNEYRARSESEESQDPKAVARCIDPTGSTISPESFEAENRGDAVD